MLALSKLVFKLLRLLDMIRAGMLGNGAQALKTLRPGEDVHLCFADVAVAIALDAAPLGGAGTMPERHFPAALASQRHRLPRLQPRADA